ncbi:MAG TPA: hypothetical protein VKA53_09240 [Thermoanaerobaculia bacterium]|nr:hypothetical protein [Thermoanaerobaculia bacterium]
MSRLARATRFLLSAIILYAGATLVVFHRLLPRLGTIVTPGAGDPLFTVWVLSWDLHQLRLGLPSLWNANIFYPLRWTLTLSDHLLGPAVTIAPLASAGLSVLACYNLLLISSFVLAGLATAWVVRRSGASRSAALIAGAIFAFSPYRWSQMAHLPVLMAQWIPLTLWFWDRFLATSRSRYALSFFTFYLLQVTAGSYLAFMIHLPLLVILLVRVPQILREGRFRQTLARATFLAGGALAVLYPIYHPYWVATRDLGLHRGRETIRVFGATVASYLTPGPTSWLYSPSWLSTWQRPENTLWAGVVASGLATGYLFARARRRRWKADGGTTAWMPRVLGSMGLIFLLLAVELGDLHTWRGLDRFDILGLAARTDRYQNSIYLLFFGLSLWLGSALRWRRALPFSFAHLSRWQRDIFLAGLSCAAASLPLVYAPLAAIVPGLDALRVTARFYPFVSFAIAVFAAAGWDSLRWRLRARGWRNPVLSILVIALVSDLAPAPLRTARVEPPAHSSPLDIWLARESEIHAILELPFAGPTVEIRRMYGSTLSWTPLVNGYSGYFPSWYRWVQSRCDPLPNHATLGHLAAAGVTHLAVNLGMMASPSRRRGLRRWRRIHTGGPWHDLELVWRGGSEEVYRIVAVPSASSARGQLSPARRQAAGEDDLGLEGNRESVTHRSSGELHQREDIAGGRSTKIDDHVGVLVADRGAAARSALEAARFDQPPGVIPLRVPEDRARIGLAGGEAPPAAPVELGDPGKSLLGVATFEAERRPGHDAAGLLEVGAPVGGLEVRDAHSAAPAVAPDHGGAKEDVPDLGPVAAGVHEHRAADGRGEARKRFETGQTRGRGTAGELSQRQGGSGHHHRVVNVNAAERPPQACHDAGKAFVRDQHVRAQTEEMEGSPRALERGEKRDQRPLGLDLHEELRRSADAQGRVAGEGNAGADAQPGDRAPRGDGSGG